MTLDFMKNALRVDYNDDDEMIQLMMEAADAYVADAIGNDYDRGDSRVEILKMALVQDMYQQRSFSAVKNQKTAKLIRSIVAQLSDGW